MLSQADVTVEQAFNRFCEVYPNLGDKNLARASFLAIPDIGNICHQIVNSVEWFEQSGKWDNWQTGQKNVSCPRASKFLNRGDWQEYMKSGDSRANAYVNSEAHKRGAEMWSQIAAQKYIKNSENNEGE